MSSDLLLRKARVANLLGVSLRQVDRLVAAGLIPPPVRLGRSVRWVRATLDEWVRAGCPPAGEQAAERQSEARA